MRVNEAAPIGAAAIRGSLRSLRADTATQAASPFTAIEGAQ